MYVHSLIKTMYKHLPMRVFTDSECVTKQSVSSSSPRDSTEEKQYQLLRDSIVKLGIELCFLPRLYQIADELASPRVPKTLQQIVQPGSEYRIPLPRVVTSIRAIDLKHNEHLLDRIAPEETVTSEVGLSFERMAQLMENTLKGEQQYSQTRDLFYAYAEECERRGMAQEAMMVIERGPPLLDCHKALALDIFSGIESATPTMRRYFRVITMDRESRYKPNISSDMVWLDPVKFLDKLEESGVGLPRVMMIASPCNTHSLMRYQKNRPPIPKEEFQWSDELVLSTEKLIQETQRRLHNKYGKECNLVVFWENPSSGDEHSLATSMRRLGVLDRLGLTVKETSYCLYGVTDFNYSKPTNIMTTMHDLVLQPPCRTRSANGRCPHAKGHCQVPTQDAETLYRIPEPLVGTLMAHAQKEVHRQNKLICLRPKFSQQSLFPSPVELGRFYHFPPKECFERM